MWSSKLTLFCVKIGENACEMLTLKMAGYEYAMNKLDVFEWHSWFKERQKDMHNSIRSEQTKKQKTKRYKCLYGNSERVMRNLFNRKESKSDLTHGFSTMLILLQMLHWEFVSS